MEDCSVTNTDKKPVWQYFTDFLMLFGAFYLVEILSFLLLKPDAASGLAFGALWAVILAGVLLCFPRKVGRILFGILYYFILLWTLAQAGYYQVFDKMMWLSTVAYAGEGAAFLGDVLSYFPFLWWIGMIITLAAGVLMIIYYPKTPKSLLARIPSLVLCIISFVSIENRFCLVSCKILPCFRESYSRIAVFNARNELPVSIKERL